MSNDNTASETREQGVDFGDLHGELENHDYPTTQEALLAEYGDRELDLADGSESLESVLEEREVAAEADTIEYESAAEVHQAVLNMVGDRAVGRTDYSDRGGSMDEDVEEGEEQSDRSL